MSRAAQDISPVVQACHIATPHMPFFPVVQLQCLPCSESEGVEEKPLAAEEVRGRNPPETGSESESSALTRVPSSPFEAAQVSILSSTSACMF